MQPMTKGLVVMTMPTIDELAGYGINGVEKRTRPAKGARNSNEMQAAILRNMQAPQRSVPRQQRADCLHRATRMRL